MVAGDAREGGLLSLFQVSRIEVAERDGSGVCYGLAQTVRWESFPAALLLLTIAMAWAERGAEPSSETPGREPVRPRREASSEDLRLRGLLFAKSIRRETLHLPFWSLVCTVQFELGGFSDLCSNKA